VYRLFFYNDTRQPYKNLPRFREKFTSNSDICDTCGDACGGACGSTCGTYPASCSSGSCDSNLNKCDQDRSKTYNPRPVREYDYDINYSRDKDTLIPLGDEYDIDYPQEKYSPCSDKTYYEKVIYDNETGTIMTGSEFMNKTGIIAPAWIPPAWSETASGTGGVNPKDFENDPRLLYNKCSLACCGDQYPVPFNVEKDPFVCNKDGKRKYLSSNYSCLNNVGGIGCLCLTPQQAKGFSNGFVDYKA